MLLTTQKKFFEENGFLVLPGFFDAAAVDGVRAAIEAVKAARPMDVVIDNLETGERTVLGLMTADAVRRDRMKVNDLYLTNAAVREMALAENLVPVLDALLGFTPALCNSLYLEKGSAQAPHVDALYMTPRTEKHLIAAWVALEDTEEDAGPLDYFPGSHRIEPMRFSHGGQHFVPAEMVAWGIYMHEQVMRAGLEMKRFLARKGDVFIWHAQLLHGGGAINNPELTRKSCVFHYFSDADAMAGGHELVPLAGAYWINRPPQELPLAAALQLPFSERNYLARYGDVAAAVKEGIFTSGWAHYENFGRGEGRLPG